MYRILFQKTDNAVWISHLDLMRLFQRAFKRAGLPLKHTQGFNPRPSVSIALPLSVGVASHCELLDFELDTNELLSNSQIVARLNKQLVAGVKVLDCYDDGRKLKELAFLACKLELQYDKDVEAGEKLTQLLKRDSVIVPKKTKNGIVDQDIIPMIRSAHVCVESARRIILDTVVCCQNPSLNPMQIVEAIKLYIPEVAPDFAKCCRIAIYDQQGKEFK